MKMFACLGEIDVCYHLSLTGVSTVSGGAEARCSLRLLVSIIELSTALGTSQCHLI